MLRDDVIQALTIEGVPFTRIERLMDEAMAYGESINRAFGFRVINTNSGMPAEYRIERIDPVREVGVANYGTTPEGVTRYYLTDEYSRLVGSVITQDEKFTVLDKYNQTVHPNNPLNHLLVEGVKRFQEWQAKQ